VQPQQYLQDQGGVAVVDATLVALVIAGLGHAPHLGEQAVAGLGRAPQRGE
jgi:hypothetical protein